VSPALKLQVAQTPPRPLELQDLRLQGDRNIVAALNRAMTGATQDETMEGASVVVLTVRDPARGLLRSSLVKTRSTLTLDRVQYRLVRVGRDGNQLTLTFEETAVNVLRDYDSPRKANRDNTTRAQFVQSLVREPREVVIPFQCPELNERQAVAAT
jgi:hypothetical protein